MVALSCATPAMSLDPALSISQYKHTRWTVDDGSPAPISVLAQDQSGFLWIGARDGLFRFDGISFEKILPQKQIGDRRWVTALMVARDGSIWVGYAEGGIARYVGGCLRDAGLLNPTQNVQQLIQTRDGAIWGLLGRSEKPLVRFTNGRWVDVGPESGLPAQQGFGLLVARDGTLWFSASKAVYFLPPGSHRFQQSTVQPVGNGALSEDRGGNIWLDDQVSAKVINAASSTANPYPVPAGQRGRRAIFDRDGNLWGSSDSGVFKIRLPDPRGERTAAAAAAKVDRLDALASLTSDSSKTVFEDREGVIWVATKLGLDRFRKVSIVTEPTLVKVPQWGDVLLAAANGDVFFGQDDGVFRARPRRKPERILAGAGDTEAMCQAPDGTIWMIMQRSIVRFRGSIAGEIGKPATRQAIIDCAVGRDGTLFLTAGEGLYQRVNDEWRLHSVTQDDQTGGAMPIVTLRNGKLLTYISSQSLRTFDPPRFTDTVLARAAALRQLRTIQEEPDAIFLGGGFGLARWREGRINFLSGSRQPAVDHTTGVVRTPQGDTWIVSRSGISRFATSDLDRAFDRPGYLPRAITYDFRDGLAGIAHIYGKRDAVRGGDGRLWFATTSGTVWIDPLRLPRNLLPPPVVITMLNADGIAHRDPKTFVAKPGTRRIAIDFNALSLAIPERVRVRYRLEGVEDRWIDSGSVRRAYYSNLRPGNYRFRVIAANEDGIWNRTGATLVLTVRPTFFQSAYFLALCSAACLLLLWTAYSLRARQLTSRVRDRLETQLSERERIARELHDTLLQGFQELGLRFQSVANRMPSDSALKGSIVEALEDAESVLTEGRSRVSGLRGTRDDADLAVEIAEAAAKLGGDPIVPISVTVEGQARPLIPLAREELLWIAVEAIRNAVQHSGCKRIDVVLLYDRQLQLAVRDNGRGLMEEVAAAGALPGHFGLVGMRERATRACGKFTLLSLPGAGTEIYVTVPGRLAYSVSRSRE
ncbi:triple tyrosine motif-containing protein [Sphingomonas sp. UYP23]